MALFVGGPYDGRNFHFDPYIKKHVRLPPVELIDRYLDDPSMTVHGDWPYHYEADISVKPSVYRYVEPR